MPLQRHSVLDALLSRKISKITHIDLVSKDANNSNQSLQPRFNNNVGCILNERAIDDGTITCVEGKVNWSKQDGVTSGVNKVFCA